MSAEPIDDSVPKWWTGDHLDYARHFWRGFFDCFWARFYVGNFTDLHGAAYSAGWDEACAPPLIMSNEDVRALRRGW